MLQRGVVWISKCCEDFSQEGTQGVNPTDRIAAGNSIGYSGGAAGCASECVGDVTRSCAQHDQTSH